MLKEPGRKPAAIFIALHAIDTFDDTVGTDRDCGGRADKRTNSAMPTKLSGSLQFAIAA